MLRTLRIDSNSDIPLYRQVHDQIANAIKLGLLGNGQRLPATRELAGQLGLNRTTVSAAYALLEQNGLIHGHVGRGSFVCAPDAETHLKTDVPLQSEPISFASSRPAQDQFPLPEFQATCDEVISAPSAASILQLGSPTGYAPLRHYLLEEARAAGEAGPDDDVLITSGCQQALDILQRVVAPMGETAAIEDPVYHGAKNVFVRGGTHLVGIPMTEFGINLDALRRTIAQERPKLLVVTPNFQNPTGATLPLSSREQLQKLVAEHGITLVENDIYGPLRYMGEPVPTIKSLDAGASTVLIRSFSKIAFPGLRVGWIVASRGLIAQLAEAKQWCDLHTDQLSQAILLRFAESGRLSAHAERVRRAGAERLAAVLAGCERHLPPGTSFTRPQGGMSLWVRLPEPLDAAELLGAAHRENVTYLPGSHFAVSNYHRGTLRLSFGGLSPAFIEAGLERLGRVFRSELERARTADLFAAAPAMV
jgi:DNA-binding transcriptional MocR family regulator